MPPWWIEHTDEPELDFVLLQGICEERRQRRAAERQED